MKMMPKKKWLILLIVFIIYILLGASFFYKIENEQEREKRYEENQEREAIVGLLHQKLKNRTSMYELSDILVKLTEYCGKPVHKADDSPIIWDFYHSVFFSVTVVTTIGYGNLAPTTSFSRIFMIGYALIGIPVNGILYATLGEYFSKTFIRIYRRWKNSKVTRYAANLGLVSQIVLYLIPGIVIFLVLPAFVIQHFEKWDYVLSIYYAFVTLTTIGFGDYVAGVKNKGFDSLYFTIYQLFLLIWIIFGLGYLVMVIGFLTRGLRSKRVKQLEKQLTHNLKSTQSKLWNGFVKDVTYFRRIMNELYMEKFKPVYRDDFTCSSTPKVIGSQSFPDIRKLLTEDLSPKARRRAFSECITNRPIARVQSDTDLHRIDREATFASLEMVQPCELIANVATALTMSNLEDQLSELDSERSGGGINCFSDSEILQSELYGSGWSFASQDVPAAQPPKAPRLRAASEVKLPLRYRQDSTNNDWTWSGPAATQKIQEIRERRTKFNRSRKRTTPRRNSAAPTKSLLERFKTNWSSTNQAFDLEKQPTDAATTTVTSGRSLFSIEQENYCNRTRHGRASVFSVPESSRVLEETSVADLLRAIRNVHSRVSAAAMREEMNQFEPKRKMGTASLTPPRVPSYIDLFNRSSSSATTTTAPPRRSSMIPSPTSSAKLVTRRKFSLHPVSEHQLMIPPPSYREAISPPPPPPPPGAGGGGVSNNRNLLHKQVSRLRGNANARILYTRTRHNSLKDLRLEKP